ncbi:LemA family protein [Ureaplasma sp. ES3154-GEN]|uniref:LemA family protein n=1 Tax=Ureaplasma sp. ES3154-GEN TaxID=2984844 RepID=UPI0021E8FC8E|nr:LemA family protein [Ureaplasma sp. ES3154-GEN]MCV3743337.1 LemA family protein [Ureaplasma sp. ES3154-GEN]
MSDINLWEQQSAEGMHPNVSNVRNDAKASKGEKALYIFFWILGVISLLGWIGLLVWKIKQKNSFLSEKNDLNEASSQIQVNQAKRFDTLNKLVEQVRSHYKFENSVLDDVTKNRSMRLTNDVEKDEQTIQQLQSLVNVAFERYPDLKSSTMVMELMSVSTWLEKEIASARRAYNALSTAWNAKIFSFMPVIVAEQMKLSTMPVFAATQAERQDVNMASLSNW